MRNGYEEQIPLSEDYVPESTYPADVCVLRYAIERHARTRPQDIFAVFEGGERWTFAQLWNKSPALPVICTNSASASTTMSSWCCRPARWRSG